MGNFNATELLSKYVYHLQISNINKNELKYARMLLADYYASASAGYKVNLEYNNAIQSIILEMGDKKQSSVLFSNKKRSVIDSAYLNATYAHGADMDDGHKRAMGHIGAPVISAVLALGEYKKCTEQEILVAIIAGYEVFIRIASAVQPGLVKRGFHSTGTAGTVACAAACAKILKLNEKGIYNAMAIAVTQASGLLIVAESGQAIKPINPANASRAGIISAMLAEKGVKGAINPLESEKGWFHAMSSEINEQAFLNKFNERNEISQCYFKPYSSCRHTHCGIEAGIKIRNRNGEKPIEKVCVYIYENAIKIAGKIVLPLTNEDTKFSIHYTLACALVNGKFGLEDLNINNCSEQVKNIIYNIDLIVDSKMENALKGIRGAKIVVTYVDGSVDEETVLVPKGDPENKFTKQDMLLKLKDCCKNIISEEEQLKLFNKIMKFGLDKQFVFKKYFKHKGE